MIYLLLAALTIYIAYNEYRRVKEKTRRNQRLVENEKRFNEFENYAYTDIRELLDFLDEVKKNDKK